MFCKKGVLTNFAKFTVAVLRPKKRGSGTGVFL